jgi:hypothetical protein
MTTSPTTIPNHYGALGLDRVKILAMDPAAADKAVKTAFRAKARELHPDVRKGGDDEAYKGAQAAYTALKSARRRRQFELGLPLGGLQDGKVFNAASAFQSTFGGAWEPPKPTVRSKAKAHYTNATRVVKPTYWIMTEEEHGVARIVLVFLAVLIGVCIWQWPLPVTLLHIVVFIVAHLIAAPGVFWIILGIVLGVLLIIPQTSAITFGALKGTGHALYGIAKVTLIMGRWLCVTSVLWYQRLRAVHLWLSKKRTARTFTP